MANKKDNSPSEITIYDVADNTTKTEKTSRLGSKYATKNTLNLCMKDQTGLSAEMFSLLFAIILAVIVLIEYFGVYMPYKRVEDEEALFAQRETAYNQLMDKLSDYRNVQAQYNMYNYENFDLTIADRIDVLELLETRVFSVATVKSITIDDNVLTLSLSDIKLAEVAALNESLQSDPICVSANLSSITFDEEHNAQYSITIEVKAKEKTQEGSNNG